MKIPVKIISKKEADKLFKKISGSGNNKYVYKIIGKIGTNKVVETTRINPETNKEEIIFQDPEYKKKLEKK